ncbi:hypothetical protein GCM10009681_53020 [Luedemannella helvata]|uniref:Segregation and condensation protein B n=1 Tax=Luedemannella helvata TaxID=349315 RepID=A0ABP4XB16_9ACTN
MNDERPPSLAESAAAWVPPWARDPKPADEPATNAEPTAAEPADVEAADVERSDVEAADVERVDVEAADVERVDVEAADVEAADVERSDVEAADVERAEVGPGVSEPAAGGPGGGHLPEPAPVARGVARVVGAHDPRHPSGDVPPDGVIELVEPAEHVHHDPAAEPPPPAVLELAEPTEPPVETDADAQSDDHADEVPPAAVLELTEPTEVPDDEPAPPHQSPASGEGNAAPTDQSHTSGGDGDADLRQSHAFGEREDAPSRQSHAFGEGSEAASRQSHAFGEGSEAASRQSHAFGEGSEAASRQSHAFGEGSEAFGEGSEAASRQSHAFGEGSEAASRQSHAFGEGSEAASRQSHAFGEGNDAAPHHSHDSGEQATSDGDEQAPSREVIELAEPAEIPQEQPVHDASGVPDEEGEATAALSDAELRGALEAVLLVVDEPVGEFLLAQVLDEPAQRVAATLKELRDEYAASGRGFELRQSAGGWRLYTRTEYAAYVERFVLDGQQTRLTQAALETLAVIAYKQPVTRSRISAIRGVNCDGVIKTLVGRGLVEECGTERESGALLYQTTPLFLEKLGINSVAELPGLAPFLPENVDEIDAHR